MSDALARGRQCLPGVCLFVLGAGRKTPAVCRKIRGEALECAGGDLGQRAAAREGIVERLRIEGILRTVRKCSARGNRSHP